MDDLTLDPIIVEGGSAFEIELIGMLLAKYQQSNVPNKTKLTKENMQFICNQPTFK